MAAHEVGVRLTVDGVESRLSLDPRVTAIGNAIFNASGVRLRNLPFTPDKLVAAWE